MRKISAMYEWSGGTDYRHTCYECQNCIRVAAGKRKVYKCKVYGNTASAATDWKPSHIACRQFNKPYRGTPVIELGEGSRGQKEAEIAGQMSIFDLPGVME